MIDYDKWCRRCKHYEFEMSAGILCALTHQKPDFQGDCPVFEHDPAGDQKLQMQQGRERRAGRRQQQLGIGMIIASALWIGGVFLITGDIALPPLIILIAGLVTYSRGEKSGKGT